MEHIIPALYALERLHAELGGQILANKEEAGRLAESMRHVEAVLKMLKPGYSVRAISVRRRKNNAWFKRGTLFRTALEVLRTAEKPLSSIEIAERMIAARGIQNPSKADTEVVRSGVHCSLMKNDGKSVARTDDRSPARWSLKST